MSRAFLMHENSTKGNITLLDGRRITLSSAEAQKLQLGQSFASLRQITDSCYAIHGTVFNSLTQKFPWYDDLNGKFLAVKTLANEWINNIAVAITSTVPTSIITFTPQFTQSAKALQGIINNAKEELTASEIAASRAILTRLVTSIDDIKTNVDYYAKNENGIVTGKLINWQKQMSDAEMDLKSGSASIQKAASDLATEIQEYNSKIDTLKEDITYYNKMIATGAGLVGGGAFVSVVGGGICFEFPLVGGIILLVGVLTIIGGAVVWGIFKSKLDKAYLDIADFTRKIADDNKTIVTLNSLSTSVGNCIDSSEMAVKNVTDFASSWITLGNTLKQTISCLDNGGEESLKALMQLDLDTASAEWNTVKQYAMDLQESPSDVKTVPINSIVA